MAATLSQIPRVTLNGPAKRIYEVSPSDGSALPFAASAIRCKGSGGDVVLIDGSGNTRTYPIDAGETLECIIIQILSTGTTATGLWAFAIY